MEERLCFVFFFFLTEMDHFKSEERDANKIKKCVLGKRKEGVEVCPGCSMSMSYLTEAAVQSGVQNCF